MWSRDDLGHEAEGFLSHNDGMAPDAIPALKSSGVAMEDVVIGGGGATQDAVAALKAGDLDATVSQAAKGQGEGALDTVLKLGHLLQNNGP